MTECAGGRTLTHGHQTLTRLSAAAAVTITFCLSDISLVSQEYGYS